MVFAVIFYAKKFFKQLLYIYILSARINTIGNITQSSNEVYEENKSGDFVVYYTILNFSKTGVPFRNTLLIRPLYNSCDQIVFLMGVTYLKADCPPLHINPVVLNFDDLIYEVDNLPFGIVLTTPIAPFTIHFVNKKWEAMCGYKQADVVGKTFRFLQERCDNKDAIKLKNKILLNLASFDKWF